MPKRKAEESNENDRLSGDYNCDNCNKQLYHHYYTWVPKIYFDQEKREFNRAEQDASIDFCEECFSSLKTKIKPFCNIFNIRCSTCEMNIACTLVEYDHFTIPYCNDLVYRNHSSIFICHLCTVDQKLPDFEYIA